MFANKRTYNSSRLKWIVVLGIMVFIGGSLCAEANLLSALFDPEVPVYPALRKTEEQALKLNGKDMTIMRFEGNDISIPDAVDYYKKVLTQKGWTTVGERVVWNNSVVIQFSHKEKGSMMSFMFIPAEIFGKPANSVMVEVLYVPRRGNGGQVTGELLSGNDEPGEDVPGVPRYPGSIRLNSLQTGASMMSAVYKISDSSCVECVADFYTQEMAKSGWKILHTETSSKNEMLARFSPQNSGDAEWDEGLGQVLAQYKTIDPGLDKEVLQKRMQERFPDSIQVLFFQNDKLNCALSISYNQPREDGTNQFSQFQKMIDEGQFTPKDEATREQLEQLKRNNPELIAKETEKLKTLFQRTSKTGIIVTINVSPQNKDLRSTQW